MSEAFGIKHSNSFEVKSAETDVPRTGDSFIANNEKTHVTHVWTYAHGCINHNH